MYFCLVARLADRVVLTNVQVKADVKMAALKDDRQAFLACFRADRGKDEREVITIQIVDQFADHGRELEKRE